MLDLSYMIPDMKTNTIKYNNKTIKLPFKDADYSDEPLTMETVTNPFSGESIAMPKFAVAVYDVIMGSEQMQDWDNHRKGLDWFIKYFPKQYGVLLD